MKKEDKPEDNTNIELIYEYTKYYFSGVEDSLKSLNTKCAGLVGFSGAFLKPFFDLPHCTNYESAKVIALFLILISVFCGIIGLLATPTGEVIHPKYAWDEFYFKEYTSEIEFKGRIVTAWLDAVKQLEQKAAFKGQYFNAGAICFALAILLSAVSVFPSLTETTSFHHVIVCTNP
jgi:hypothetical protein